MVTIGIPFFNDEKYLTYAVRSVINQTYKNWVLYLINDGSNDSSLEIAEKYAQLDSRIFVINDGKNLKLATRLNQLITLSKTKYLARMDADDIMHPERIEKQLAILERRPQIDVLGTNVFSIDKNNQIKGTRQKFVRGKYELKNTSGFIHPTIMAETVWFKRHPYDERMKRAQDYELWYRAKKDSCFITTTEPLLFYREINHSYYKKYLKAIPSMFYVAFKYGTFKTFYVAFRYVLKAALYCLAHFFKLEKALIRRRNLLLNKKCQELFQRELDDITVKHGK